MANTAGELYLASLAAGSGADPDRPSYDPKLRSDLVRLIEMRAKLYQGLNSEFARYERQQLVTEAKLLENINTTRARVFESIQQNKRVSAKDATDMKKAIIDARVDLTTKIGGESPAFAPINTAYNAANGGEAGLQSAARALIAWKDNFGHGLSANSPEVAGMMNKFTSLAVPGKQDISRVTRDQVLAALGTVDQATRDQVGYLFDVGQQRFNEISGAIATLTDAEGRAEGIEQTLAHTGVSTDPSLISQFNQIAADLGPAVSRGLGRSEADIAIAQEQFLEGNKELQRLESDIDLLKGSQSGASTKDRMGRIVADPKFRMWAEGNGFRLGSATIQPDGTVTYAPMVDDAKALALFNYQAKTGKYGPLFASRSTGKTVRVTYEDPASREKALATYSKNGQFFMGEDGTLMSPAEAARAMNPSDTVQVGVGADFTPVFKLVDGRVVNQKGEPASADGVKFVPGTVKTVTGVRYLQGADLADLNIDDLGMAKKPEEVEAAARGSGEKAGIFVTDEAGARQAWTGVVVGKLDRPNARDIIDQGESYISLDGGKVTIPGTAKATIELLPKGTEVEPMTKEERLAEADKAAMGAAAKPRVKGKAEVPTVTVTTSTAGGVVKNVEVPVTSTAAQVADAEGRPLTVTPQAPKAAPAPAPVAGAPAPAAPAAPQAMYYKDNEGSTFEVTRDGVTWLSDKEGKAPPADKKTKFTSADGPVLDKVVENLTTKGTRVEKPAAVTETSDLALKEAPLKSSLEGGRVPRLPEPEPEAAIGRRGRSAVVVYPEAEAEKPSIAEWIKSKFPRRKKEGEEEGAPAAGGAPEVPGTAPAPEAKAKSKTESPYASTSPYADMVAGAAGVPERAPNAAVPPTFEERAKVAPGQFGMAQAAAGARGEGASTLKVGDIKSTGYQTATKKYSTKAEQDAAQAQQAAITGAKKEPVNMPTELPLENTGGFTLEGAPRQNLFSVDQPAGAATKPKLGLFNRFRNAAFAPAPPAQE